MRGTNRRSRYNLPFRIVPQPGKVGQDLREAAGAESSHIFHEDVAGSNLANDTGRVGPEPAVVFRAFASTCEAGGLARESGRDDLPFSGASAELADVIPDFDVRPVLPKDRLAVGVDLDKSGVPKAPGAFESKCDPSNPLEESEGGELLSRATGSSRDGPLS
jgi:hypothetical protein